MPPIRDSSFLFHADRSGAASLRLVYASKDGANPNRNMEWKSSKPAEEGLESESPEAEATGRVMKRTCECKETFGFKGPACLTMAMHAVQFGGIRSEDMM